MREFFLVHVHGLLGLFLSTSLSVAYAETDPPARLKPTGLSLEWYQHELDLKVTDIKTSIPGITPAIVDSIKGRLNTSDQLKLASIRLDYQLRPYLNVYGSIGKITGDTRVDFSNLGAGISDLVVDNRGMAYTVGAILSKTQGQLQPSLQFIHSRIKLDGNANDIQVNAIVPTLGVQTDYGVLDASLAYQAVQADYSGTVVAPFVGQVPVTVRTENKDKFQVMAGWRSQLAKDLYLNANVGLNGQQQFRLMLNKRF